MKNYEVISELMKFPAGYEVNFGRNVSEDEFTNGLSTIFVGGTVSDIEVDETEGIIEFL